MALPKKKTAIETPLRPPEYIHALTRHDGGAGSETFVISVSNDRAALIAHVTDIIHEWRDSEQYVTIDLDRPGHDRRWSVYRVENDVRTLIFRVTTVKMLR